MSLLIELLGLVLKLLYIPLISMDNLSLHMLLILIIHPILQYPLSYNINRPRRLTLANQIPQHLQGILIWSKLIIDNFSLKFLFNDMTLFWSHWKTTHHGELVLGLVELGGEGKGTWGLAGTGLVGDLAGVRRRGELDLAGGLGLWAVGVGVLYLSCFYISSKLYFTLCTSILSLYLSFVNLIFFYLLLDVNSVILIFILLL